MFYIKKILLSLVKVILLGIPLSIIILFAVSYFVPTLPGYILYDLLKYNPYDASNSTQIVLLDEMRDILPLQPASNGNIPIFVSLVREALQTKDISICESLPIPSKENFIFGDYFLYPPTQSDWKIYCNALVMNNQGECKEMHDAIFPELRLECREFFRQQNER